MRNYILLAISTFLLISCSSEKNKILLNKEVFNKIKNEKEITNFSEKDHFVVIETDSKKDKAYLESLISEAAHDVGKCGGYTLVDERELSEIESMLDKQELINRSFSPANFTPPAYDQFIADSIKNMSKESIQKTIQFLVDEGTRSAKANNPNKPIDNFIEYIHKSLEESHINYELSTISHNTTPQKSIKVKLLASEKTDKVIILGGHIDSVGGWFSKSAPGADDNASGSAVILETLKLLTSLNDFNPKINIEFFWYAGEEQGLKGSKEIAKDYARKNIPVEAVMQLDMVLYPGNGDVIGLTTDNTNDELTLQVEHLVKDYLNTPVERFKCGYGCSDHASWHQNGFKTVYPFEATFRTSNSAIHSGNDVIGPKSDMDHALEICKNSSILFANK